MGSCFTTSPVTFECNAGSQLRLVMGGGLVYITDVCCGCFDFNNSKCLNNLTSRDDDFLRGRWE